MYEYASICIAFIIFVCITSCCKILKIKVCKISTLSNMKVCSGITSFLKLGWSLDCFTFQLFIKLSLRCRKSTVWTDRVLLLDTDQNWPFLHIMPFIKDVINKKCNIKSSNMILLYLCGYPLESFFWLSSSLFSKSRLNSLIDPKVLDGKPCPVIKTLGLSCVFITDLSQIKENMWK